jgi:histidinol-phosphate aminotransferase
MGASPLFLQLDEKDDFTWTDQTFNKFKDIIAQFRPKLIWISNPNNPTGQIIPDDKLHEIIKLAYYYNVYVVVDEAYHEFIGDPKDSAVKYTNAYKNLMVIRTFSKAHGLAGLRLGYLICSNPDIIEALLLHRHHFPVTQLSLNIARIATKDMSFIQNTRENTNIRRNILFKNLDTLNTFKYIPSQTSIFMLKSSILSAHELDKKLKSKGIITSQLNITGITPNNYLRITVLTEKDNEFLFQVCKEINAECQNLS